MSRCHGLLTSTNDLIVTAFQVGGGMQAMSEELMMALRPGSTLIIDYGLWQVYSKHASSSF